MGTDGPDVSRFVSSEEFVGETHDETIAGRRLVEDAHAYVSAFQWCDRVVESFAALMVPPVVGVILVRIDPLENADPWLWIIVGDVPPAHIHFEVGYTENVASAVDGYIGAMSDWVTAVDAGESTDRLIPVNADASQEYATMLRSRLDFLDRHILAPIRHELSQEEDRLR